jgi:hypothetical protein
MGEILCFLSAHRFDDTLIGFSPHCPWLRGIPYRVPWGDALASFLVKPFTLAQPPLFGIFPRRWMNKPPTLSALQHVLMLVENACPAIALGAAQPRATSATIVAVRPLNADLAVVLLTW